MFIAITLKLTPELIILQAETFIWRKFINIMWRNIGIKHHKCIVTVDENVHHLDVGLKAPDGDLVYWDIHETSL